MADARRSSCGYGNFDLHHVEVYDRASGRESVYKLRESVILVIVAYPSRDLR
jgi:hypothetical protein